MKKALDLKKDSVSKLFFNYLIPAVMGMLIMSLHIVIDGIFVGRGIGSDGLAAVNIVVPFFSLFAAMGILIGLGGATVVSIKFGEGKEEEGNSIFTQSIVIAIIISIIITVVSELNIEKLSYILGANDKILLFVKEYMRVIIFFAPIFILVDVLNCFVRNDRAPKLSMYAMIIGAIINCCLDYIFIFKFHWELSGAALATGISNILSITILLMHFMFKKGDLKFVRTRFVVNDMIRIFKNGFPNFLAEMSLAAVTLVFNLVLMKMLGEIGVSAYGIINYIHALMLMVFIGISQAVQPIISYNYGAKEYERARESFKLAVEVSVVFGICFFMSGILFGKNMVKLFNNNNIELMELTTSGIKIYFINYLFMGVNMVTASYFQAIEKTKFSTIITLNRGLILIMAGLFILPKIFKINGIWITTPVAEAVTLFVCWVLLKTYKREIEKFKLIEEH
ncbi:MATE family efflux transporter [Crassaminicella profunda]|uniref:MATE family efflux transporter n=1 Tax=Crassaminicella profunda TaxID=1286698 RepID=UPI001CA731D6|nr:MATE family efflux transporter [Crassaminicella profunda]QZY56429.1 MATE family efflux transporter [Crassaminicella profunda]